MRKSDLQLRFRIHKEYNTRGRPSELTVGAGFLGLVSTVCFFLLSENSKVFAVSDALKATK